MRTKIYLSLLSIFMLFSVSCSEASMEDDARRAAELSMLSNQYSIENDMSAAGRAYDESQQIMNKYKNLDKFDEFYLIYISFLEESAYRYNNENDTQSPSEVPSQETPVVP